MINKQANILFIPTSISGNGAEVQGTLSHWTHQQLIYASLARSAYTIEELQALGERVAAIARHAWAAKDLNAVEQASKALLALPNADQLENTARYYQSLCIWWRGDPENARQSLAHIVEESTRYGSRALQIIGLTYHQSGEIEAALPFYLEAGRRAANSDLLTLIESQRMMAVVQSIHGDHKRALQDLEKLFPSVRAVARYSPVLYYEFLNSLAVELAEIGRLAEAEAASSIALASPLAAAYPEWADTRDEIIAQRVCGTASVVAVSRAIDHVSSPQAESHCNSERVGRLAVGWPATHYDFFQRSTNDFPAKTTMVLNADSILDRVLICIGPRAPPIRS